MEDPSSAPDGPATSSTVWTTTNVGDARADEDDENSQKLLEQNQNDNGNFSIRIPLLISSNLDPSESNAYQATKRVAPSYHSASKECA